MRRVLIVEDQAALRMLVAEMLSGRGWETATASDAAEATRLFAQFDPDVLLTDIDLGSRPSGAELALMLTRLAPHLGIVFLSSYPRAAAGATVMGIDHAVFVAKQELSSADDLVAALEQALSVHPAPAAPVVAESTGLGSLTRHQLEVLSMIAQGWSNEQIAAASASTVRAVERSVSRIFDRLGVSGDTGVSPRVAVATMYVAAFGPPR